jgi:hypothetical protein
VVVIFIIAVGSFSLGITFALLMTRELATAKSRGKSAGIDPASPAPLDPLDEEINAIEAWNAAVLRVPVVKRPLVWKETRQGGNLRMAPRYAVVSRNGRLITASRRGDFLALCM